MRLPARVGKTVFGSYLTEKLEGGAINFGGDAQSSGAVKQIPRSRRGYV